jgi:hypothetical protein
MGIMTMAQALEKTKDMTFEKMFAFLAQIGEEMRQNSARTDEQIRQASAKTDEQIRQMSARTDEQLRLMSARTDEQIKQTAAEVAETTKSIQELTQDVKNLQHTTGGLGNTLGGIMEDMFASKIWNKFDAFGFKFTKAARDLVFRNEKWEKIAETDAFLENGDYVMAVEVKSRLEISDINKHVARLEKIRAYLDERSDKRKLLGAIAAGCVLRKEKEYAEEKGLFVLVQDGDAVTVAENPGEFTGKMW